jgi:hypothetical protein
MRISLHKRLKNLWLLLFLILIVFACKDKKLTEATQIVGEWVGKEIRIPDNVQCAVLGRDTALSACSALTDAEYKVLLYVDSSGCSSCRLKLAQWESLIAEADSLFSGKLSFLLFFQPKNKNELAILFQQEKFYYPVFIDMKNAINRLNRFPEKPEYQCFLLDKDNKVQIIGNPASTPIMWDLYKHVISGQQQSNVTPVTSVSVEHPELEIKGMQAKKTSEISFTLKNTGTQPLVIRRVDASCGCTVPEWEKRPIALGESTEIKMKITPERREYFNKTVTVYCNTEKGQISLTLKGTVE